MNVMSPGRSRASLPSPARTNSGREQQLRREAARARLIEALGDVTASAELMADDLLRHMDTSGHGNSHVMDLRFVDAGTHAAHCISNLPASGWDALQAYAQASGGSIEKVIFSAAFSPDMELMHQMKRLKVRSVDLDFDDAQTSSDDEMPEPPPEAAQAADQWLAVTQRAPVCSLAEPVSVMSLGGADSDVLDSEDEMSGMRHDARTAQAAAGDAQARELIALTHMQAFREHMFVCCQTPAASLQARDHALFHELRYQLGDSEIVAAMSHRDMRDFFLTASGESMIELALRKNPWVAAAITLGILESAAPLKVKASYLMVHAPAVIAGLSKVKGTQAREQAQHAITEIQRAWAPAAHLLRVTRKNEVMLRKPASADHSRTCKQARLTVVALLEGGTRLMCAATREIADLRNYEHSFDADHKLHLYAIPTDDLDSRSRSLLHWS